MRFFLPLVFCLAFLSGCGVMPISTNSDKNGILIENIRVENYFNLGENIQYFTKRPSCVLVIGAAQTETLLDMEVEDSIAWAVKYEDSEKFPIKASNQKAFNRLNFLPRQEVTLENVLVLKPDMIIGEESWFSKNRLGSTDYWNKKGVYTMVSLNTTSPGKTNEPETVEQEMKYIRDMGKIYRHEKQAEKIVNATMNRFKEVRERTKGQIVPKVMIIDLLSTTISYGKNKIAGDIATQLGGQVPITTATISDEFIMKENPDIVFVITYGDGETRLERIRKKKVFQNLSFIRDGRLYEIPLKYAYGPMTRTIDAAGYMAERMYPGQFHFPQEYDFHSS